jgi:hypothetical protein
MAIEYQILLSNSVVNMTLLNIRYLWQLEMEQPTFKNVNNHLNTNIYSYLETSEAIFLVMCDPSMNEL